jgi:hypothetical protein
MNTLEKQNELDAMISRVEVVQSERSLKDSQLIAEYPDLGSAKTWCDRLKTRKWSELNLDRWLGKLKRIMAILDGGSPDEDYDTSSPFHEEMLARLTKLERQPNDRRILVCLAANGCGKSSFTRWAVAQSFASRAQFRLRPSMRNKPIHIYNAVCAALGEETRSCNIAEAENTAIKLLKAQKRTLFFDQAHEGGVVLMHILRAFVDETPSRFVWLGYDTAYKQVLRQSNDAQVEAQAWLGRCMKPAFDLYKSGTVVRDVAWYLQKFGGMSKSAAESLAASLTPALNLSTNLRLLDDAISAARHADNTDDPSPGTVKAKVFELSGLNVSAFKRGED